MLDGKSNREERSKRDPMYADLMAICDRVVASSDDRLRLVFGEKDTSVASEPEAAHFLKLDGKRISRDIELIMMLSKISGPAYAASDFLESMLIVSSSVPVAYKAVEPDLIALKKYFEPQHQEAWDDLFEKVP